MRLWPEIVVIVLMAMKFAGPLFRALGYIKEIEPQTPGAALWGTAVNTAILVWLLGKGGFWTSLGWTP